MKSMKRFVCALSILSIVFALAACGNAAATPNPSAIASPSETHSIGCPVCAEREEQEVNVKEQSDDMYVEEPCWTDAYDEIVAPNGNRFKVPGLPGYSFIIDTYKGRCLMSVGSKRELWLCTQESGFIKLSGDQLVINWTVAYDTIYWFNMDQDVWAVDWWESDEAYLFCEDAIAVSPHADEGEGAVVDWERANNTWYGVPIYSPV